MGEAVVSSDEVMVVELQEEEGRERERERKEEKEKSSSGVVRWGRFLPRMVLRVLLVEADDSTRQIIAALLRKCSYEVAAVSDGLKAWETLKGGTQNVDLILTEVELPSISGFALLTLIMEDDICKKIPVIMMSSHDSISVVLKCMLKGAADFLIKPVRKNELRNLWQHVWRRQAPNGGHLPQNFSTQNKVEASSENNTASSHSSDYVVSAQKMKECGEKGSDTQGLSQLKKCRNISNLSNKETRKHEDGIKLDKEPDRFEILIGGKTIRLGSVGSEVAPSNEGYHSADHRWEESHCLAKRVTTGNGAGPASHREGTAMSSENHGCNEKQIEPSSGAIDLISTFDIHPKYHNQFSSSNGGINKDGFAPQLELSLRRFQPGSLKNRGSDESHKLNHSSSSAFSWYNSGKTLQPLSPTPASSRTEPAEDAHEQLFNQLPESIVCGSERHWAVMSVTQGDMITLAMGQSNQAGATFSTSQLGFVPIQGENNLESMEEQSHGSPVAGQSASSSLCNGVASHLSSSVHGSICSVNDGNPTPNSSVMRTIVPESVNNEDLHNNDRLKGMDSHNSTQREAALMKFRLKRKDRCFEKKVRYQSRKRLAEQRPRVKGQFVRQVRADSPTADG